MTFAIILPFSMPLDVAIFFKLSISQVNFIIFNIFSKTVMEIEFSAPKIPRFVKINFLGDPPKKKVKIWRKKGLGF
jgi:hypothetical protein